MIITKTTKDPVIQKWLDGKTRNQLFTDYRIKMIASQQRLGILKDNNITKTQVHLLNSLGRVISKKWT